MKGNLFAANPADVVLGLADVPTGWRVMSEGAPSSGIAGGVSYIRAFETALGAPSVNCTAIKCPSVSKAKEMYAHYHETYLDRSKPMGRVADESVLFEAGSNILMGAFRKSNFLVFVAGFGGAGVGASDIVEYLRACERKIR